MDKAAKEAFVSGLEGTTLFEVMALAAVVPVVVFLRRLIGTITPRFASVKERPGPEAYVLDFVVVVLPVLLAVMIEHSLATILTLLLITTASVYFIFVRSRVEKRSSQSHLATSSRKPYLAVWRSTMMITTCICILGVDFHAFPRRFAKTETFGTSLMDVGVGSFVLANALLSPQARAIPIKGWQVMHTLRRLIPLVVLGTARIVVTSLASYQVHVGEYGVHWNFFYTLAVVALLAAILPVPPRWSGAAGAAVLAAHQAALSKWSMTDYIMTEERDQDSLLDLNKEGICSIPGYFGLHLLGVQLGHTLLHAQAGHVASGLGPRLGGAAASAPRATQSSTSWSGAHKIWLLSGSLWASMYVATHAVEEVSRRSTNVAYVCFMLAYNLTVIGSFYMMDLLLPPVPIPLLQAINDHLLFTFLVANMLTGLVNVSVHTMEVGQVEAVAIVALYLGCVCFATISLDRHLKREVKQNI
ncbi:hypothetical protein CYMTET_55791 [Cymbomonas tetramitiformis]|uniref:GPI-anchored wall transfer protein n=1 Tax=Cymbomonas tetramitiformis TaxID=36881 RepID=A0AAE0EPD8_9CHLO|nr:hypothetical protein CYMTET_55791 [Cymbomonas tetramitiformis]